MLAIQRVSVQFLFVDVDFEHHLVSCYRVIGTLILFKSTIAGKGNHERLPLDMPAPTIDLLRRILVALDAPCAVGVIDLELAGTKPATKDRFRVVLRWLASGSTGNDENDAKAQCAHEV